MIIWRMLLRLLPGDLRNSIAGDLEEDCAPIRARYGPLAASVWLLVITLKLSLLFQFEKLSHGRPLPPIRDEIRRNPGMFDSLKQDILFGIRMLRRQPTFAAVAILALTLGIGVNTAIFSVADAVLWRPLPYTDPDRIMQIAEQRPKEGQSFGPVSPADYFDWRRDSASFEFMAAYYGDTANVSGDGEPERIHTLEVSTPFFHVLGIEPLYGRDFLPEEETEGRDTVAILTDAFWRQRFGGDSSIVGRNILLDGNAYQVVGILPSSFWWQSPVDVVVPLAMSDHDRALRSAHFLKVLGRLDSGITAVKAADELNGIGRRLAQSFPRENTGHGPNIRPFREALVGDARNGLVMLLGAVGFVLLIACTNVATLLLARAAARQRELAVRKAVGASRLRLVQQMLTESLILAFCSGAAGLVMASWSLNMLRYVLPAQVASLPGMADVGIDRRVLLGALAVSTLTGLIFGIGPALAASRRSAGVPLNEETRGNSGGRRALETRSVLVIAEVALSLILLVGAGLLIASFRNLVNVSPGFRSDHLVAAEISLPGKRYPDNSRTAAFFENLYERLKSDPASAGVAATEALPFSGEDSRLDLDVENHAIESTAPVRAHPRLVSTDYLRVMGIPILRGRPFSDRDNASSPRVVIINDAAARKYWPGENPLGQRISLGSPTRWMQIVGVAGSVHHDGLESEPVPEAYIPQLQGFNALGDGFSRNMMVLMRTSADPSTAASFIKTAVKEIDPEQPVGSIQSMDAMIDESVAPRRLNLILMSAFALLAVTLTAAGLYGVMSFLVIQRTREIGVRVALGATRLQILGMIFKQAGVVTGAGLVIGFGGSLLLTKWMTSMLFGVSRTSPAIYAAVCLLLALVAVIAVAIPSRRATQVDPLAALRDS
jgi:predicted permease